MKTINKILGSRTLLILIAFLGLGLLVSACTSDFEAPNGNGNGNGNDVPNDYSGMPAFNDTTGGIGGAQQYFSATYSDGAWNYEARIAKGTPCHTLEVREIVMESYPEQIIVSLEIIPPADDEICIMVLEYETVQGRITAAPGSTFRITLNGEQVYNANEGPLKIYEE